MSGPSRRSARARFEPAVARRLVIALWSLLAMAIVAGCRPSPSVPEPAQGEEVASSRIDPASAPLDRTRAAQGGTTADDALHAQAALNNAAAQDDRAAQDNDAPNHTAAPNDTAAPNRSAAHDDRAAHTLGNGAPLATTPVADPAPPAALRPLDESELAIGTDFGAPPDAWPLFRGDPRSTGYSQSSLPDELSLLWRQRPESATFEATAAIAEGRVFVGSLSGPLYALHLETGELIWTFETELGFYAAPAVRDGRLYIGDANGMFYCLDAASGELIWQFESRAEIDAGANFYRDCVLFGSQDATLYCLRAADGELVWTYEIEDQIRCAPTVVADRAFIAGCDSKLHIVDLARGESLARVDIRSQTGCTAAVLGPLAFFGTEGDLFYSVDWQQAEIRWSYRHPTRRFPYRSSAAVTPEAVVVGGRNKLIEAFDPRSGELLWSFAARGRVDASPVIVGSRAFVGSADGRLFGLDLATGQLVWEYEAGGGFTASPAVASGRLVVGTSDGQLLCFGAQ